MTLMPLQFRLFLTTKPPSNLRLGRLVDSVIVERYRAKVGNSIAEYIVATLIAMVYAKSVQAGKAGTDTLSCRRCA